jgi:hypothetical protein
MDRKERREIWRKVSRVSLKAGESLASMIDQGVCNCGGMVVMAPPVMARELLLARGKRPVEHPSCDNTVVYRTPEGARPMICNACHRFSFDMEDALGEAGEG